uniref:Protein-serine/threonine kinase n=1 Tax=Blastobotrys adeninivorans TaxID=409370 RepID=A0A060T2H5_BLAAD
MRNSIQCSLRRKRYSYHAISSRCLHSSSMLRDHSARLAMLETGVDIEPGLYTYPPNSPIVNARHFYQNTVLMDHWIKKEPRPVSLRQLAFFGRKLNEQKLISSANFCRVELPVRIAHRIREMQVMPFSVVSNQHLCEVYEAYYRAFDLFRKFPAIKTLEDNDRFCDLLDILLNEHLSIIPKLVIGVIECSEAGFYDSDKLDEFVAKSLKSRISRRVIAEQHLSLTRAFRQGYRTADDPNYVGEVFLQCSARETVEEGAMAARQAIQKRYPDDKMPQVIIEGANVDIKFPYIKSHLDYIVGEIMRNSFEATIEQHRANGSPSDGPPPIVVSVSNTNQNILFRVSDQGGGVPTDLLPHIWSFAKGPRSHRRMRSFQQVPKFKGIAQEASGTTNTVAPSSLGALAARDSGIKLGMGLPLSRIYAEYWDGTLELQSLEGYGCDVFLRLSRLGNQHERLELDRV